MKAFRTIVVVSLVGCAVPIVMFVSAWALSAASGCQLQFEAPHVCTLGSFGVGWLVDKFLQIGVWGALTFGAAVYIFAAWVTVELAAIVLTAFHRS